MRLRDLEYFCYLYKVGTFTKVAQHFNVEQPTITLAIKRLETSLQTKLVFRNKPKNLVQISPTGNIFYKHAINILQNAHLASIEIENYTAKKIRFGLPPIIGSLYFPLVIEDIVKTGLLDNLEIDESGSQQLLLDLSEGKIDIALLGSLLPIKNKNINTKFLTNRNFVIVSSTAHWLNKRKFISFADLKDEPFITLNEKFIHSKILELYSKQVGFRPNIVFKTENIETLIGLIKKNIGIGLLVSDVINFADDLSLTRLKNPLHEKFNISVATRKDYIIDEQEKLFISKLLKMESKSNEN